MFHVLEGELEVTIRGETVVARPGQTVNIPALAPHAFMNPADTTARTVPGCARRARHGIDNTEVISAVHSRRAPTMPASAGALL
jgi:uncharacterized cupin superfamily protein